ncbi:MAG TPA: ABC transporter permease subunit [Methanocella sp.]|jgi:ABC-2 type transport system permease protein
MIDDIKTVLWKEIKEEILSNKQVLLGLLVTVPVFGIMLPWNMGRAFVEEPYLLIFLSVLPLVMVINILTDSFAGERERHTLETLLATRLSDHAILFGKIMAAVAYAWGGTILTILTGLITVNVAFGQSQILLFSPLEGLLIILITLLLSILITSAGVLVSLRASTVRQAETSFLVGMAAVAFIPMVVYYILPDDLKEQVLDQLVSIGLDNVMVMLVFGLVALIAIVLSVAMNRFQRNKLILD